MSSSNSAVHPTDASRGLGLWGAVIVSYVVSPLAFPPLVYGLVLIHVGAPWADVVWGAGIGFVFLSIVPLVYVGGMRLQGRIESLEIRDRSRRTEPFLVALVASGAALAAVLSIDIAGRRLLAALVVCHALNTTLLFLITMQWKISVHCASVAGAVSTLAFVQGHVPGRVLAAAGPAVLIGGAGLTGLVLWARVRGRAHTMGQAVVGAGVGLVAPYLELMALSGAIGG
ncbi:hypothetical protein [Salinibacter altiplanensis]|uniref:hypothetical protein n=1 Tax=Salinibacter altiplanensis TaxID=1803181 RepID=UPI001F3B75C4|nr:hypothetical protein [Salinibacter altiplanensis]